MCGGLKRQERLDIARRMFRRLGSVLVLLVALEALPYVSGVCPAKGVTLNLREFICIVCRARDLTLHDVNHECK